MIAEALNLQSRECVAVVGAGGKTGLCWLLLRDIVARGERVIFTTTTRIRKPQAAAFDVIALSKTPTIPPGDWRTACIASAVDGQPDDRTLTESLMPVVHTKLAGFTADQIRAFYQSISNPQSPISLLIEADGARGLLVKAPSIHEPSIPTCATIVCVVASLEALGQPLDEHVAHRPERIMQITGARIGTPINASLITALLTHSQGGLKGIPPGARRVAVLMQRDEHVIHPDAQVIATALCAGGYEQVIVLSPRAKPARLFTTKGVGAASITL